MLGNMLRHYRVDAKIGEGGMGVVYKGWDTHLDRPVALKVLAAEAVANPERKRRFVQEAKAASALNHPNIVTIYDVDNVDGVDFIAMEFIDGDTLDRAIGRTGMKLSQALKHATQVADALARAHGAGIVHRDLKPANVMVDRHGLVKVLDFGLAKLTERGAAGENESTMTERPHTEEGAILGTVAYMSPEQAEGKTVDARSDIFSFGSMLYEMVTGARPFQGDSKVATMSAILSKNPEPLSAKAPGVPHELERIVARCLRKDPDRRFPLMKEVKLALEDLKDETESASGTGTAPVVTAARGIDWRWAAAAVLVAGVGIGVWMMGRPKQGSGAAGMTRMTSDSGWTTDPALSADGKLLAYASDRATGENLDIWIQHLGGGEAARLTSWDSDELEPDFSPDGSRVVFRSNRNGGGIYLVPVLGGEPMQIAPKGFRPRFSPDGSSIAYWTGSEGGTLGVSLRQVLVVAANGGTPRRLGADLAGASFPAWSPDGKRLLVSGWKESTRNIDWFVIAADGGASTATGMMEILRKQKLPYDTPPGAWLAGGDAVLFSAGRGESANLYRAAIASGDGKITQEPERITFGTGIETKPALGAGGQLALGSETFASHLWSLPVDANQGKVTGEMKQLTRDATVDNTARISPDGKRVVYFAGANREALFLLDLESGARKRLAAGWSLGQWLALADGGRRVLIDGSASGYERGIYSLELSGGVPSPLQANRMMWNAREDGRFVISRKGDLTDFTTIDVESKKESPLASSAGGQLLSPSFSPDGKWVAMHVRNSEMTRQIWVFPFHEGRETPKSERIPITAGKQLDHDPHWSPDGNLLYFLADREGVRGIHARRLEAATKRPVGEAFEVKMFRGSRRSMMYFTNSGQSAPAVARDKLVFALGEMTGNIWMTRLP